MPGHSRHHGTRYITLDSHACRGCWECIAACPESVIGKIDMPFHHHARIDNPENCKGCQKCVKACQEQAIMPRGAG
jgi:NAD-dependent dihydropyrimidine dehydrogenase PreA subunit